MSFSVEISDMLYLLGQKEYGSVGRADVDPNFRLGGLSLQENKSLNNIATMKNFDFRKFLSENKLTSDSKINEMQPKLDISQVDMGSLELDGFSQEDPTDLADVYIVSAQFLDGTELTDDELEELQDLIPDEIYDRALDRMSSGAEDAWDAYKDGTY
jgi:uncharacterized protein YfkK (UPF0435 family)